MSPQDGFGQCEKLLQVLGNIIKTYNDPLDEVATEMKQAYAEASESFYECWKMHDALKLHLEEAINK